MVCHDLLATECRCFESLYAIRMLLNGPQVHHIVQYLRI